MRIPTRIFPRGVRRLFQAKSRGIFFNVIGMEIAQQETQGIFHGGFSHLEIVVKLLNGSALAASWAVENLPAIIDAWYPGEAGGEVLGSKETLDLIRAYYQLGERPRRRLLDLAKSLNGEHEAA